MRSILCPNCSAPLEVDETQSVVKCPYCKVQSKIGKKEKIIEHFMLPVAYDVSQIRTELVGDLLKQPGAPDDLHKSLKFTKVSLKYYPYWIITVHNRSNYTGNGEYATYSWPYRSGYRQIKFHLKPEKGVFDDEREFIIFAAEEVNQYLLDFQIATRGKVYHDENEAKKIKADVVPSIFNLDQAKQEAVNSMRDIHKGLILREITQIIEVTDNPIVKSVYQLHIPFYFLNYDVHGRSFDAIMDGATGRTVITKTPRSASYWVQISALSVFFGILCLAGIFLAVQQIWGYFGIFGAITGGLLIIRTLQLGFKRRYQETRRSKTRKRLFGRSTSWY